MSNQFYPSAREGFADGSVNWMKNDIMVAALDTSVYTFSPTHRTMQDVPESSVVAISQPLEKKSCKDGALGSSRWAYVGVYGNIISAMVVFQKDGRLIAYIDEADGLPVAPNGGTLDWGWPDDVMAIL